MMNMRDETIRLYQRLLRMIIEYNKQTDSEVTSIFRTLELIKKMFKCKDKGAEKHIKQMAELRLIEFDGDNINILYTK
jgi:hypothetical protein